MRRSQSGSSDEEFAEFLARVKSRPRQYARTKFLERGDELPLNRLNMKLERESPQVLAAVVRFMKPFRAAEFLMKFPEGVRSETLIRLNKMDIRDAGLLEIIEDVCTPAIARRELRERREKRTRSSTRWRGPVAGLNRAVNDKLTIRKSKRRGGKNSAPAKAVDEGDWD